MKRTLFNSFLASITFSMAIISSSQASTNTWNGGGGGSFLWSNAANWGGVATNGNDTLIFGGNTGLTNTNDLTAGTVQISITFNNTSGAFVLGGNLMGLSTGVTNNDADTQTINLGIDMSATNTWNAASGNIIMNGVLGQSAAQA